MSNADSEEIQSLEEIIASIESKSTPTDAKKKKNKKVEEVTSIQHEKRKVVIRSRGKGSAVAAVSSLKTQLKGIQKEEAAAVVAPLRNSSEMASEPSAVPDTSPLQGWSHISHLPSFLVDTSGKAKEEEERTRHTTLENDTRSCSTKREAVRAFPQHGIRLRDAKVLLHLLASYDEGNKRSVALFLALYRSLNIPHGKVGTSPIRKSMFSREKLTVFDFQTLDPEQTYSQLSSDFKGKLGILQLMPPVPEPLPSGVYGEPYVEHSRKGGEVTAFFLNAIRSDQRDVVHWLLLNYPVDTHLKHGCCIDDPLHAAVTHGLPRMCELILRFGKVAHEWSDCCSVFGAGNNAGEAGSMSCGMDKYALPTAVENKDMVTLSVLLNHVAGMKRKKSVTESRRAGRTVEKALAAAISNANIPALKMMLDVGQFSPNVGYHVCSCPMGKYDSIKDRVTPLHRVADKLYGGGGGPSTSSSSKSLQYQTMEDLLVEAGADWLAATVDGTTPQDVKDGKGTIFSSNGF